MSMLPSTSLIADTFALITGDTPHLALYTSNPTADDTGVELTGSYARQPITFGSVSGGSILNTTAITFSSVPTGNITHFGIKDSLTAGELKVYGELSGVLVTISGDEITFEPGSIQINLAGE